MLQRGFDSKILADDDEAGRVSALILDALRQNGEAMDRAALLLAMAPLCASPESFTIFALSGCTVERNDATACHPCAVPGDAETCGEMTSI